MVFDDLREFQMATVSPTAHVPASDIPQTLRAILHKKLSCRQLFFFE
jgi:hypothetical protein